MAGPVDHRAKPPLGGRMPHRLQVVGREADVPARRPITVLYVEDDDDDVFLLGRQLEGLPSFQVEFAHAPTLAAARSMISRHRFDVVLCDFWLGSETTIPLIDELKMSIAPCPVVLVSSLENDDIELIGRRAGAAGFVAKADLTAASLDRVFGTLIPPEDSHLQQAGRPGSGVALWLKALLRSLDKVHAASQLALDEGSDAATGARGLLADIVSNSAEIRNDIMEKLAGLERATRQGAGALRFDAVPYLVDAVRALAERAGDEALVAFSVPSMPIMIETSPTLFGDLVQGFFAEALEVAGAGAKVTVSPLVTDGFLTVDLSAEPVSDLAAVPGIGDDAREVAAADARRFLVETLARASGGAAVFGPVANASGRIGRLSVPLRTSFG